MSGKTPYLRWYICGLLFYATTVNYLDRQVIGLLKPVLSREMGWHEADYGWVVFAFQSAYALTMPLAGQIIDRVGTRLSYALAVVMWSVASMSHALARSAVQFAAARFFLGVGEAGNFPAAIKTVAAWFPKRERALATGIFNSGANLGALIGPLLVPFVAGRFGWRFSFVATGLLDLLWVAAWLAVYRPPREHKSLSAEELAVIESDGSEEPARAIPYLHLLGTRAAWAFLLGKFLTDPVWWFYLFWLPGFLNGRYGLNLASLGPPLITVYLAADVGSVAGGWLSGRLLARGYSLTRARKTALVTCALAVVPVSVIMRTSGSLWLATGLVALAGAAHQGWSANLFTLVSDTFPSSAVASVVGLGGLGGALGGMLISPAVGYWLDYSHGAYGPLFFCAGFAYLFAFLLIHVLLPKLEPVKV